MKNLSIKRRKDIELMFCDLSEDKINEDTTMLVRSYFTENSVPSRVTHYLKKEDAIRIVEFLREQFKL